MKSLKKELQTTNGAIERHRILDSDMAEMKKKH